jgi:putative tryptophan/tyrosine transport system substrate-binding protein
MKDGWSKLKPASGAGRTMRRRAFITLLGGAAAWPVVARAQQPGRVWRIGFLGVGPPSPALLNVFRDSLRERGYVEGQNMVIDVRWPQGSFEANPGVVTELLRNNVDVIVAWATPPVIAARRQTSTIPIVMVEVSDPVGMGFVASLARPGGNVTGNSNVAPDLSAKLVGTFVQLVPSMSMVGVVVNLSNPGAVAQIGGTQEAIRALGLQYRVVNAATAEEFEVAFARLSAEGVKGVVLLIDPSVSRHAKKIAELAQQVRLPTAFQRRENVEMGGLMCYGADYVDLYRQAGVYVGRILKGEKPADLPVMQPTKFVLVINRKTASSLGLELPPSLLAIADEVIE